MKPYGCHNRTIGAGYYVKVRKYDGLSYEMVDRLIKHTMSTDCKYDKNHTDKRCKDCRHISL